MDSWGFRNDLKTGARRDNFVVSMDNFQQATFQPVFPKRNLIFLPLLLRVEIREQKLRKNEKFLYLNLTQPDGEINVDETPTL